MAIQALDSLSKYTGDPSIIPMPRLLHDGVGPCGMKRFCSGKE
ncbi:MAG: hypothetical protein SCH39_11780 [Methanosarcinales archaeon]|nr:hypothetical protein [Methanosarcinales archaeon]